MIDRQTDHIRTCEWDDKLHCRGLQLAVDVFSMITMGAPRIITNTYCRDCHTHICKYEVLADFNLVVMKADGQTAKFNSLPNFQATW